MKRPTIKDVSRRSGFSISTVSRVINGHYPVKEKTKAKVQKSIKELNFNRNNTARNLRTRRSSLVALVVADINNAYYSQIAKIIDDGLFGSGYNLLICNTDESIKKENKVLKVLVEKGVDALAISSAATNVNEIQSAINSGVNVVLLDRMLDIKNVPFVGSPDYEDSKILTQYLVDKGHKKIALIAGTKSATTSTQRYEGYKAAMEANDLAFDESSVIRALFKKEEAYKKVKKFLKKNLEASDPYTAIYSSNNVMTIGLIEAIQELGLKIPDDISVVSFGELDTQEIIIPKITCIKQDINSIAIKTRKILISLAENNSHDDIKGSIINGSLEIGKSVKNLNNINGWISSYSWVGLM